MSQYAKNTAIFSALTLLSRLSGMIRLMVFAFAIGGRTVLADSFQLAFLIPNTIYEFIAGGLLSAVFIPLLVKEQEEPGNDARKIWQVANALLGGVGFVLGIISLISIIAAPWIIDFMTAMGKSSYNTEKQEIATYLFRYFAPQILFLGVNAIFMAILNSLGIFAITAAAPILNNVFCIVAFLAYYYGLVEIQGLAVLTTLGTVSMALIQLPFVLRAGMPLRPVFNPRHEVFKSVTHLGWPVLLVSIANLVGWSIRSNLLNTVLGAFAIYTFCFQIIMMPYGIFAVSIATVLFPTLSRHAANKRRDEFVNDMALGFRWTTFIMLPISFGLMVLAMPVVRVLFEHRGGMFTYSDSLFASDFLKYYALSIAPYALVMFATRVFYSVKDTMTPAIINIVGVIINAVLSYIFLKRIGASGIALAATLNYVLTTTASLVMIRSVTKGLGGSTLWIPLTKMLGASLLMAFTVSSAEQWTRPSVSVLEKGSRLDFPLPAHSKDGSFALIRGKDELVRLWNAMGRQPETIPPVNMEKNQLVLAWGPSSETTTSLELTLDGREKLPKDILMLPFTVHRKNKETSGPAANDVFTSPSYALIQVASPALPVTMKFTVSDQPVSSGKRYLIDPELTRLVLLILLGAIIYGVSAIILKIGELETFLNQIKKKLTGRIKKRE